MSDSIRWFAILRCQLSGPGHNWGPWLSVPGSCEQTQQCAHCGTTQMMVVHRWGTWKRAVDSCDHTRTCQVCGEKVSQAIHHWVHERSQRKCLNCGISTDIPGYSDGPS